ncbi:MAG: LD-carboxypeptidase [Firmicutes bacterium]|nr:LD-carboxypeptidase [Bacillota bacterium]
MNRGKRLEPGDTIGIIAPASFASSDQIEPAVTNLTNIGYRVRLGKSSFSRWHSFAGDDQLRAGDINSFFEDDTVKAIICLRGGYGVLRLLDKLDYNLIMNHPKILVGYSDLTLLHLSINQRADLITFHGPMLTSNFTAELDSETKASFEDALCFGYQPYQITNPHNQPLQKLVGGKAEGVVIGGNLTLLMSTFGTKYQPDLKDKILFIEDVKEATYRIDRMLTQLILSGMLQDLKGIIIGSFNECNQSDPEDMPLEEVFLDRLANLGIPVIANFQSGHCVPLMTLPLGALIGIDADQLTIEILEKVVD